MLARQQADSSEGGFAKLAPFSSFSFHFFNIFCLFFLMLHMGSQGLFWHCYGLGFSGWDLVQGLNLPVSTGNLGVDQ